ncbi:MAG: signal recognition particle receptor subunit alpha, partial [Ruminococcus sp.]|nr:signal recognition particle receptor subunit alpha [Candidatus Apopatosoma intestinale]
MGFLEKLKEGLSKTRTSFIARINDLFSSFVRVDEDLLDELEEILITADIGVETTEEILDKLREAIRAEHLTDPQAVRDRLFMMLRDGIGDGEPIRLEDGRLTVLLVIGVNGVGKTTSIAKIAHVLKEQGKNVLLCAADTFRAAAIDQLAVWADRVGVDLIHQSEGADPAAVVFDALGAGGKRGTEVLIVDSAGPPHNKKHQMMARE